MTEGWQRARLDEACLFLNGLWKGKKPPFTEVGVIRNTNFAADGVLDYSDIACLDVEAKQFEKRRLQRGDIILEKSGGGPKQAVGRVVLFEKTEGDFSFSNFTSAVRVRDAMALDYAYLHKYLHWVYVSGTTESMQSHSTGIRNLNGDAYKSIEIAYPNLQAQQRIVAILDEAFAGIATAKANAEKNLQNVRELFETEADEIVSGANGGWTKGTLEKFCESISTGPFGSLLHKSDYAFAGVPLVNPINIVGEDIVADSRKLIDPATAQRLCGYVLKQGDIVIGRRGEIGRCAVVGDEQDGWMCGTGCFFIRPLNSVSPYFLARLMRSRTYREMLESASTGATMMNLSNKALASLVVSMPTYSVQIELLAKIDALGERVSVLESTYNRKLSALDKLKQSLLAKAFAGEL